MGLLDTLGFLGFGNMGEAILCGLLEAKIVAPESVFIYDLSEQKQARATELGLSIAPTPSELASASNTLVLATKPQDMEEALNSLAPGFAPRTLIVSVAAGISIRFIQERLDPHARVARVMPNTPALVGAGATGLSFSDSCAQDDIEATETIFNAVGITERFSEDQIDAVTALSGSGPAYFLFLAECMVAAAVKVGLSEDQAARLAGQTLYGAGRLLHESDATATELRERVTSKGGTTFAALEAFRSKGFQETIEAGVKAATSRSKELGL